MSIATTIYDENVEWVFSGAATLNPADNGSPHTGLLDMRATASLAGDIGQWKAPSPLNSSSFVNLSVWIQKTGIWTTTTSSVGFFWLDPNGNQVGNVVVIQNGAYGFSSSNAAYQNVVIPAGDFGLPVNAVVQSLAFVTGTKTSLNYFLDTIVLTSVAVICKPSNLIAAAKCFPCLTPKQTANIRSLLLSQFVPCVPVGGGAPVIGCNAPLAPNNLATSGATSSTFTVSWQQPVGGVNVSQYLIIWSQFASLFTPSKRTGFATVSGSTLSYTITGLQPSTTYFVEVIALNSLCQSPASVSVSQATTGVTVNLPQLGSLFLELESLDFDGTANGTALTLWTDKSGHNNFNLVGAALNANPAQPTVDGGTLLNGHKTVRFNNNAGIGAASFNWGATGVDLIIVYKPDEPVVNGNVLEGLMRINQATNNAQPFTDNNFYCGFGRTDRPNIGQPVTSLANFVAFEQSSKSDNSSWDAWMNTEHFFTSAAYTYSNVQQANQTTLGVGYTGVVNQFLTGNIAAVYGWNTVLSTADRLQARAYIKQTWGNGFGF